MKILIFGSAGFLGTRLKKLLSNHHKVIGVDVSPGEEFQIDISSEKNLYEIFKDSKPDLIIDLVALTSSVGCEKNPNLAEKLNYQTAVNLLELSKKLSSKFIFLSSSYVFDGRAGNYSEEDLPNPQNVYAKTKLAAEKELPKYDNSTVLRVDLLYGTNGKNKPNGFLGKILSDEEIFLGNPDQKRSPLLIDDLAEIIEIISSKNLSGIFHASGDEKISQKEFYKLLAKNLEKHPTIKIIQESDLLVKPLKNTSLNNTKIKGLDFKFHSLGEGIGLIKSQLK